MRTPGHAVLNLALLGRAAPVGVQAAIVLGAVLPDVPIVVLYLREKARGTPTPEIWRTRYQERFWQNLIHGFHALPISLAGALVCTWLGVSVGAFFFASVALHALLDLPVHARDAHRHFLPFSQWRLISPLSYWDVTKHARPVTAVEWALVVAASVVLAAHASPLAVGALVCVQLSYLAGFIRLFVAPEPSE